MIDLMFSRLLLSFVFIFTISASGLVIYGSHTETTLSLYHKMIIDMVFGTIIILSAIAILFILMFGINT